jgi:hypothetical protein
VADIQLEYHPRDWQRECHRSRKRFTVLALHRRAGKTELALMQLLHSALKFTKPLGMFVYVAPYLKQSKAIAWARLKAKVEPLRQHDLVDVIEGELKVVIKHNGAIIQCYGADLPDALRGLRVDGCVLDEVAQVKPEIWDAVLQPALSDRLGWALMIGTPAGINLFSQLYYKAQAEEGWHAARYTVYDTQSIDPDEVDRLKRDMAEMHFAREYLCDFTAAGDDQLISLSDAEAASQRTYRPGEMDHAPVVIGVDPARFGDDRSVIVRRQGLTVFPPKIYRGIDNMDLAGRVANEIHEHNPDAVFIDAGAGAGVIDRLRQLGHDPIEVPFGGRATDQSQYINRRTEMWCEMADWLVRGGSIPNDRDLKLELATPKYWFDTQGRKVLEPKDDIKKRLQGGGSPDIADALALTFAMNVGKKTDHGKGMRSNESRDYDPYAFM